MSYFVANSKNQTDIIQIDEKTLKVSVKKQLSDTNSICIVNKNYIAYTTKNNVLCIQKLEKSGELKDIATIELKDDVKNVQFSPNLTYVQILTYQTQDDNTFIYDITGETTLKFQCKKFVSQYTNIDYQPFVVVFNQSETLAACQIDNQINFYDVTNNFEKVNNITAYTQDEFIQTQYYFANKLFILFHESMKDMKGKIQIIRSDYSVHWTYTNAKVNRIQIQNMTGPSIDKYIVAKMTFEQGSGYYGNSQLILLDVQKKQQEILVKTKLQACALFTPKQNNTNNTQILITTEGNPCTMYFTTLRYNEKTRNIFKDSNKYQNQVYINSIYCKDNLLILRGETGMDGDIYIATLEGEDIKIFAHKQQRDVTHINIINDKIIFSTQQPRFREDNSYYINDYKFQKQEKFSYDGLRYLREIEFEEESFVPTNLEEIEIDNAKSTHLGKGTSSEGYVPPQLRKK